MADQDPQPTPPAQFMAPDVAASRSVGLPFGFAEFALGTSADRPPWLYEVASYLQSSGALFGTLFDASGFPWMVLNDCASIQAWRTPWPAPDRRTGLRAAERPRHACSDACPQHAVPDRPLAHPSRAVGHAAVPGATAGGDRAQRSRRARSVPATGGTSGSCSGSPTRPHVSVCVLNRQRRRCPLDAPAGPGRPGGPRSGISDTGRKACFRPGATGSWSRRAGAGSGDRPAEADHRHPVTGRSSAVPAVPTAFSASPRSDA